MNTLNKAAEKYANEKFESCKYNYTEDKRLTDVDKLNNAFKAGAQSDAAKEYWYAQWQAAQKQMPTDEELEKLAENNARLHFHPDYNKDAFTACKISFKNGYKLTVRHCQKADMSTWDKAKQFIQNGINNYEKFNLTESGEVAVKVLKKIKEHFDYLDESALQYSVGDGFQSRVDKWMKACFGEVISKDKTERNHRFIEEALELVQSLGCTKSEAHQLVDYVFNRPQGEPYQECGGVMVTIAALCLANKLNMDDCGEKELSRVWAKIDKIREKQAAKPKHSPLPSPPINK